MQTIVQYSAEAKEGQDKLNAKEMTIIESTVQTSRRAFGELTCSLPAGLSKLWTFFFSCGGRFIDDYKLVIQQTSQRDRTKQTSSWVPGHPCIGGDRSG